MILSSLLLLLFASGTCPPPLPPGRARAQEIRQGLNPEQLELARRRLRVQIDEALARIAEDVTEQDLRACARLGRLAAAAGDLEAAERAQRAVLEVRERQADDAAALHEARASLAATLVASDPPAAVPLLEAVLEHLSRSLSADDPELLTARQNLGAALVSAGDGARARLHLELVTAAYEASLSDDDPRLSAARLNLAGALHSLGELEQAGVLLERALASYERSLPHGHLDIARARLNLATNKRTLGDARGALALEREVVAAFEAELPPDSPYLLYARGNLASSLRAIGELDEARTLLEDVLEAQERSFPAEHPELQKTRYLLAITLSERGELLRARGLFEEVLAVRERSLAPDDPLLLYTLQSLSNTVRSLGDAQGARAIDERVLTARERSLSGDHVDLLMARECLALSLSDLGEFEEARTLLTAALEGYRRLYAADHPHVLRASGNLATLHYQLRDAERARELEESLLAALEERLPPGNPRLDAARANLAATLTSLGDHEGARAHMERALEGFERSLPADHPDLQSARCNLLDLLTLESVREDQDPGEREALRARRAALARRIASDATLAARSAISSASSREAEERASQAGRSLGKVLSTALSSPGTEAGTELLQLGFVLSETTRSAGLSAARVARSVSGTPEHEAARAELRAAGEALALAAQSAAELEELHQARTRRERAERELARIAGELPGGDSRLLELGAQALGARLEPASALLAYRAIPLDRVGGCGKCELQHVHEEAQLVAFVLRAGEERAALVTLGALEHLEPLVGAWRSAIAAELARGLALGPTEDPAVEPGRALRRAILDPLLPALGDAERLIVAPDDLLHLVPLDALPLDGSEQLVGERWQVETRLALGELLARAEPPATAGTLVALGGASFNSLPSGLSAAEIAALEEEPDAPLPDTELAVASFLRGGAWERGFAPLPYTAPEAAGIAELFAEASLGATRVLLLERKRASREALLEAAPRARWLHVATHGWFAPESVRSSEDERPSEQHEGSWTRRDRAQVVRGMSPMLLCGLALAGANLPADPSGRLLGLMTAEELSTLDLAQCELAVLSACDTNVGERRAGQGVASLQKALHMAGARSVITSLWKVPDEATRELMLDFYRRLWVEGKPKRDALWEAKLRLRAARDEAGRARYATRDWAAWVLSGAPD